MTKERPLITRVFTQPGKDPYTLLDWTKKDATIIDARTKKAIFEQENVEVPSAFSDNATQILASKYFRPSMNESSFKQVIDRIVNTITQQGIKKSYFITDDEAKIFSDELKYVLASQTAAFNSPVWFNIGVSDAVPQSSACFILSVEDDMNSILNWYREEGIIFKGGSGSGVNLSKIRSSKEKLSGGGIASGPVSFMRGADASAGTIKSGGKTRRAAKMVILNVDHPDIKEFIWCKAIEERKARVLAEAGFDMAVDGKDTYSLQYQNANNSVRVTDNFMQAVIEDSDWTLKAVTTKETIEVVKARDIFREIAQAAWECADPGLQFDTTINKWHTCANTGRINASNPCSEYMHLDNSACNLSSINLVKFIDEKTTKFDVQKFIHVVTLLTVAQDILISFSHFPTDKIWENALAFRQIGLGFANLGALLMRKGLAYDSDEGRAYASAVTSLLTGSCYAVSAQIASRLGAFEGYLENKDSMLSVMDSHKKAAKEITLSDTFNIDSELAQAAVDVWDNVLFLGEDYGFRNAQATAIAPTGTIGLLMDCDTTGIEPELALVKTKHLSGGGTMTIENKSVYKALQSLHYEDSQIKEIIEYIRKTGSIVNAPHVQKNHYPVFATAFGNDNNEIHYMGHVKMIASVQPFVSGAISKTVNVPNNATVQEIEHLYQQAWQLGVKALAIYRDGCKVAQPLQAKTTDETKTNIITKVTNIPERKRLPRQRKATTRSFSVANLEGYITVGEYDNGTPGEIFLRVAKQGSTLAGILDALSIAISLGLQYGVPLEVFIRHFINTRFEPSGMTNDSDLRIASSVIDYIFRRIALDYLPEDVREELGVYSVKERIAMVDNVNNNSDNNNVNSLSLSNTNQKLTDAPLCLYCGSPTRPSGSCYVCPSCGSTTGCS